MRPNIIRTFTPCHTLWFALRAKTKYKCSGLAHDTCMLMTLDTRHFLFAGSSLTIADTLSFNKPTIPPNPLHVSVGSLIASFISEIQYLVLLAFGAVEDEIQIRG